MDFIPGAPWSPGFVAGWTLAACLLVFLVTPLFPKRRGVRWLTIPIWLIAYAGWIAVWARLSYVLRGAPPEDLAVLPIVVVAPISLSLTLAAGVREYWTQARSQPAVPFQGASR